MGTKKKKNNVSTVLGLVVLGVVLVLMVVWFANNLEKSKNGYTNDPTERTEAQKLLDKNFDNSYPATEREVVKIYCRLQQEIYYGESTEDEKQALFKQMRKLYDEELLAQNSYNKQYEALTKEIEQYNKDKIKITNYQILQESGDVQKGTYKGYEQALVDVCFKTKEKDDRQSFVQEFVLRKDDDGRWKILGWYKVNVETGEENE